MQDMELGVDLLNIISVTEENLEKEHICCSISNNKELTVRSKKDWLKERFQDGLVFLKADVRGKVFIEYLPAEKAWCPIEARDYMFINCLWVSGKYKGQGISNKLLDACILDSKNKGKKGLVILSAKKKMPFLSDPKYLIYKGFQIGDTLEPYYELMYLPFEENLHKPYFNLHLNKEKEDVQGFEVYYTHQCPFTAKYVSIIEEIAIRRKVPLKAIQFQKGEDARKGPNPFTTYSLYYNGTFITNEILSGKKFEKLLDDEGFTHD
jgi:ribosomal protein S18 acetylase RimI-like enzyme